MFDLSNIITLIAAAFIGLVPWGISTVFFYRIKHLNSVIEDMKAPKILWKTEQDPCCRCVALPANKQFEFYQETLGGESGGGTDDEN